MKIENLFETIRWYNDNAAQYARAISEKYFPEEIAKFINLLPEGAKVLDVGCAAGRDTAMLAKEGLRAVGLDLSTGLINIAKNAHRDIGFVQGDFLHLPFADNEFDGIWASAAFVHLEEEEALEALKEFGRVLKTEGILYLVVKAPTGEKKSEVIFDSLTKSERFFCYFTSEEMVDYLEKTAFELIYLLQYTESDRRPGGRPDVEWIWIFARAS